MALNSEHPGYTQMHPDWVVMLDTYAGERRIKDKGASYLLPTPAMVIDGFGKPNVIDNAGDLAYERYKARAVFWDYVSDAVKTLVGMLHQKPATIKLPTAMEPLIKKASREGETLQQLLRRIHEQQLVTGRLGLLADLPDALTNDPNTIPYIALYNALSVINWDVSHDDIGLDTTRLVVLNETAFERTTEFTWREVQKYRVLQMSPMIAPSPIDGSNDAIVEGNDTQEETIDPAVPPGTYCTGVFRFTDQSSFDPNEMIAPTYKGRMLQEIPFQFVNSSDLVSTPETPPLIGLARICLAIYRGEADYRQSLFMQGQDTLVIIGGTPINDPSDPRNGEGDTARRVGAGATIDVNVGGDAKYIGVGGEGLAEQRSSLENDKQAAASKAGQLISPAAGKQESGDALTTRVSAQTASLTTIAKTGAAALEAILKQIARWMGLNEAEVIVEANTEFLDQLMTFKDLSDAMDARMKGAPTSLKSIHDNMLARGMTEMTFEEEIAQILIEKSMPGAQPVEPPSVTAAAVKPATTSVGQRK